jgi:N-acetylmuramoyl-L-alanine amidase
MTFERLRALISTSASGLALAAAFSVCLVSTAATKSSPAAARRETAQAQFSRAQDLQAALNSRAVADRDLDAYKRVVSAYRRVYLVTPNASEAPEAILSVAQIYEEMGKKFGSKYSQSAVDTYQFLIHAYPGSSHCPGSLLEIARLQRDELNQPDLASKSYEEYLRMYPRSPRRREIQERLAELALSRGSALPIGLTPTKADVDAAAPIPTGSGRSQVRNDDDTPAPGSIPRVRSITTAAANGTTRIIIDIDHQVTYQSARIHNPDRIYFDISTARLSAQLAGRTIAVKNDLLTEIRVAQNQAGVVRVVFDIAGVQDYTASMLNNPPRLVVELHGQSQAPQTLASNAAPAARDWKPFAAPAAAGTRSGEESRSPRPSQEPARDLGDPAAAVDSRSSRATGKPSSAIVASRGPAPAAASTPNAPPVKSKRANVSLSDPIRPSPAPQPTRDSQQSLTRTLGLKIGRIVIDPGHGGHDTGTIGPTGFMEKDLCLDVALRLGKIIEQRLPGADVIYTRQDDTFIPLEERTAIANQAKADLFLSIHANSSDDRSARGIETYYLNIKGTPEAMEVAARENATAEESVHQLQDLVAKIAQNEKLEESREFASEIQDSLSRRIQKGSRSVKNRGVRKAPFVVLIGAHMPSVLTEISFLSNPSDEQLLKKPEIRQRVADGLYQGVAHYLQNLNSLTYNLPHRDMAGRSEAPGAIAQSGNQR